MIPVQNSCNPIQFCLGKMLVGSQHEINVNIYLMVVFVFIKEIDISKKKAQVDSLLTNWKFYFQEDSHSLNDENTIKKIWRKKVPIPNYEQYAQMYYPCLTNHILKKMKVKWNCIGNMCILSSHNVECMSGITGISSVYEYKRSIKLKKVGLEKIKEAISKLRNSFKKGNRKWDCSVSRTHSGQV